MFLILEVRRMVVVEESFLPSSTPQEISYNSLSIGVAFSPFANLILIQAFHLLNTNIKAIKYI